MTDLGSTLLGAGLAVVGGFMATVAIRWLDNRRDDRRVAREFKAAAILVDDELAANLTMLQQVLNVRSTDLIPQLQNGVYTAQQLALALGLPRDVRAAVAKAYAWAQLPDVQVFAKALDARDETESARKALKPYVDSVRMGAAVQPRGEQ